MAEETQINLPEIEIVTDTGITDEEKTIVDREVKLVVSEECEEICDFKKVHQ